MSNLRIAGPLLAAILLWCGSAAAASLYQEGTYQSLTSDRKARHRGDLLTVMVYENASASTAANTIAGRDANVGFDFEGTNKAAAANVRLNNQHDGRGHTRREGRVLAQITVAVLDIAENGDLLIGGEQLLEINNERQQIKLRGRVRRQDISDANTVLSTRIGDARISYAGDGDLSDKQRAAWWQRVLTLFGL